jgi:hypothetical protein
MKFKFFGLFLLLFLCGCILISCGKKTETKGTSITANYKDKLFNLTLYVDKDTYSKGEAIQCYATVEYICEDDSITVYSSDPLVGFGIKDDKYFDGGYTANEILMATTFNKGETKSYDFVKSGGWSADDPNAEFYEEFYKDKKLILPPGKYQLSAAINYSLDPENVQGSNHNTFVSVFVMVEDNNEEK